MDSSHVGVSLAEIQKEQETLDKLIDSLLSVTAASSQDNPFAVELSSPVVKSPTQSKRGRGRPPKLGLSSTSSPVLRENNKKPSLEGVIECINKLNVQNKKLLEYVKSLSEKENGSDRRCVCAETNEESQRNNQILTSQKTINVDLSDRLEKVEQNLNSNVLICRGPGVTELISQVKTGSTVNYEGLKGNLCRAVCGENVTEIDIKNLQVSVFGREKKSVKIDCGNTFSKLHIVKQARQKKPRGIYVSEFLTKSKLSIFQNLRNLKKLHPEKISSVYTRDGNIFYRQEDVNRAVLVKSMHEIENIIGGIPNTV